MAINIVIPDNIIKKLNDLPKEIRLKFWNQLERLTSNPSYPSLRNEKLKGTDQRAFSITMNYRATYIKEETTIIITSIETHKDVLGS